jgi:hypothetical protein
LGASGCILQNRKHDFAKCWNWRRGKTDLQSLASPSRWEINSNTHTFLYSLKLKRPSLELKSEKYWTSGKFPQKGYNRTYEWATVEPFQRFTYTNWQSGKPGHSDFGYCVYFFMDFDFESGYYWVDYSCYSLYLEYICESV